VKYAWIEQHNEHYSIPMMCDLLGVSRSGLYGARQRARMHRKAEDDAVVVEAIRVAQRRHTGRYGCRRMAVELGEVLGRAVNHKAVFRILCFLIVLGVVELCVKANHKLTHGLLPVLNRHRPSLTNIT